MTFRRLLLLVCALLAGAFCALAMAAHAASGSAANRTDRLVLKANTSAMVDGYGAQVAPLLTKYCGSCHGETKPKGKLTLTAFKDEATAVKARATWEKVLERIRAGEMPPEDRPKPTAAEVQVLAGWIERAVLAGPGAPARDPGRVTLRRLNRAEYSNTIRDLLGISFQADNNFPADDVGYGFDNIGDVLSLPPMLMEKYLAAAEKIADQAIITSRPPPVTKQRISGRELKATLIADLFKNDARNLFTNGEAYVKYDFPSPGEYAVRIRAFGEQAGRELPRMSVRLDRNGVQSFDVAATIAEPKVYEAHIKVQAGVRRLAAAFVNDFFDDNEPDPKRRDRNLLIEYMEIEGPLPAPEFARQQETHRRIFICEPTASNHAECARQIIEHLARRAYRRPPTATGVNRLGRLVEMAEKNGDSFERGIQLALQAILVSPHFLYRVETDPEPANPAAIHLINDYELATRLSYFLWSSMPDDELFQLAARNQLRENLAAQTRRMLRDPKAVALTENFAGQWLQLRNLGTMTPDAKRFPTFDDDLRAAMQKETELFFAGVVREDRSILEFLDANYTYANERLAQHYGIPGVMGKEFRRIRLPDGRRGGVITQASVLTVTSNPTRTSPVKRGKWILENLLGTPPPPPPPDAGELKEEKDAQLTGTLRQRMEQHRANPNCATCHQRMDPLGFGLENFDAIGGWREKDGNFPIDSSGTLPSGQSFRGPAELKGVLCGKEAEFRRCFAEKLLTYALGRGLEYYDRTAVEQIAITMVKKQNKFSAVVWEVVKSEPFQKRRGQGGSK